MNPTSIIRSRGRRRRSGAVLVWCALLLPVLIGMVGLVVDAGMMMATYREAHNAADAAAMAGAYKLLETGTLPANGYTNLQMSSTASTAASLIVTGSNYNGLSSGTASAVVPPTSGPYGGNTTNTYVQATVTLPLNTYFIPVYGFSRNPTVTAKAVAGIESVPVNVGVLALNPTGVGLSLANNTELDVNGPIQVNSSGTAAVDFGNNPNATIYATQVGTTAGTAGVNSQRQIFSYSTSASMAAQATVPLPDPYDSLPPPTPSYGGVISPASSATFASDPNLSSGTANPGRYLGGLTVGGKSTTVTMTPGVYIFPNAGSGLTIGGNVTMNSGIYVIAGGGMTISNLGALTASGVMIYNTGADYLTTSGTDSVAGAADKLDLTTGNPFNTGSAPTDANAPGGTNFGQLLIDNGSFTITPLTSGPFAGISIYQRRANTQIIKVGLGQGSESVSGTIYAKWANLTLTNQASGTITGQVIVNSFTISQHASLDITDNTGSDLGRVPRVFLVD